MITEEERKKSANQGGPDFKAFGGAIKNVAAGVVDRLGLNRTVPSPSSLNLDKPFTAMPISTLNDTNVIPPKKPMNISSTAEATTVPQRIEAKSPTMPVDKSITNAKTTAPITEPQPTQNTVSAVLPKNYEGRPVEPYSGASVIPQIGTYTDAQGNKTYTNIEKSALTDEQNLSIINKNREDAAASSDQLARNNIMRNAADTIQRAYNQPTRQNLKAARIAQDVLREAGITDVAFKKLLSGQGLTDAELQTELAKAAQIKAQTKILPGSFEETKATPKITLKDIVDASRVESVDEMGNKTSSLDEATLDRLAEKYGVIPKTKVASADKGTATKVPAGYTKIGIDKKDGKAIYRDPNGNTVKEE